MSEEETLFKEFAKQENFTIIRDLGKGGYGWVKEIKDNKTNNIYAAKLLGKNKIGENEVKMLKGFKGPGIVKITKVSNLHDRYLIIMEKSILKDLDKCIYHLHKANLLNLIFYPFEIVGNNLLRFFIKNLLNGMEVLNRYNYAHFDIKPQNILIFKKMIAKFIDFSLLRNIDELKDKQIPNTYDTLFGTHGYVPPEIYLYKKVDKETAIKYDYFSFGATIFALKFGDKMIDASYLADQKDTEVQAEIIIDLLEKARDKIKSKQFPDKGFNEFLCSLIQYKAKERPDFEKIYRNQWVHKNSNEINQIFEINELDEEKLLLELDKSDYLLSKNGYIKNKNENIAHKNNKKINRNKFIFKKKK